MISRTRRNENQRTTTLNDSYHRLYQKLNAEELENVGNYHIIKQIGEGSFGKVYMAVHKLTKTKVVLKSGSKVDPNVIREIFFHKQAFHGNITRLFEVIVTETSVYLAIEYCLKGELYDYFVKQRCQLTFKEIKSIFSQIASAVFYMHSLNIAHRDLKLENILIDKKNNCKLSDFGFSRDCYKNSSLKTVCGTHVYMAPELLLMNNESSGVTGYSGMKIDIWALGIILYTLLYGQMPFDDDEEDAVKNQIINTEPNYELRRIIPASQLLPASNPSSPTSPTYLESNTNRVGVPEEAVQLCKWLLAKDAAKRPSSVEAILKHPFLGFYGTKALKYTTTQLAYTRDFANMQFLTYFEKHLVKHLKRLGFDTKKIKESVVCRKCDQLDAIWHLLLEKESKREKLKERFRQLDRDKGNSISGLIGSGKKLGLIRNSLSKETGFLSKSSSLKRVASRKSLDSLHVSKSAPLNKIDGKSINSSINKSISSHVKDHNETIDESEEPIKFRNIFGSGEINSSAEDSVDKSYSLLKDTSQKSIGTPQHRMRSFSNVGRKSSLGSVALQFRKSSVDDISKHPKSKAFIDKLKFWVHKAAHNNSETALDGSNSSRKSDRLSVSTSKKSNESVSLLANNNSTKSKNSVNKTSTYINETSNKNFNDLKVKIPKTGNIIKLKHKKSFSTGNAVNNERKPLSLSHRNSLQVDLLTSDNLEVTGNVIDTNQTTGPEKPAAIVQKEPEEQKRSVVFSKDASPLSGTSSKTTRRSEAKNSNNPTVNPSARVNAGPTKTRPGSMISTYSAISQLSDLSQLSFNGTVLSMDTPTYSGFNHNGSASNINTSTSSSSNKPRYNRSRSFDSKIKRSSGAISSASYSPSTSEQSSRKSSFYDYSTGSFNYRSNSPDPFGDSRYNVVSLTLHKLNGVPDSPTPGSPFAHYQHKNGSVVSGQNETVDTDILGKPLGEGVISKVSTTSSSSISTSLALNLPAKGNRGRSRTEMIDSRYSARRKSPLGSPYSNYGIGLSNFKAFGNNINKKKKAAGIRKTKSSIIEEEELDSLSNHAEENAPVDN